MDISNGPGVRVSIFMQGCTFHCKNCFNPETHDFMGGEEFTEDTIDQVLKLCENANIEGLSILGGEPMHPMNIEGTTELAKKFKDDFKFTITQVIGLTNDDEVSKEFRPYKQMIERLNRTYKVVVMLCLFHPDLSHVV